LSFFLPFGMFYGHLIYLIYFLVIWCISSRFGMLHQEKSGNPAHDLANKFTGINKIN
jgi:hypothetical protein